MSDPRCLQVCSKLHQMVLHEAPSFHFEPAMIKHLCLSVRRLMILLLHAVPQNMKCCCCLSVWWVVAVSGGFHVCRTSTCRVEELALPTRAIQLSGEVLSTDEAASAELRKAEAVHQTRSSCRLFKAAPMTPCICREQQLETGLSNKCLKHMLEFYSTAVVRPSEAAPYRGAAHGGGCVDGNHRDPTRTQHTCQCC